MKRELMEILACPECKGELELDSVKEEGNEVLEGALFCGACGYDYPIEEGIPNLIPIKIREQEG